MASIQCGKCKNGIHYHGEAKGIVYYIISKHDWDIITSSKFDPSNKEFLEGTNIPKLFLAETIESDFPNSIKKIWRCPECGSLLIFDVDGNLIEMFEESTGISPVNKDMKFGYLVFDDYTWESLTDSKLACFQLLDKVKPNCFGGKEDSIIIVSNNERNILKIYKKFIPTSGDSGE